MENILDSIGEWFVEFADEFYQCLIYKDRWLMLLKGLGVTLQITFLSIIVGTILGIIFALMKISKSKFLIGCSNIYTTIFRGTPLMIQLLIIYFVIFASINTSKILIAVIAFGLNSGAYVAEIVRAGIMAVDKGQMEAGRSLGLNYRQTMTHIILPQAAKNILPTYTSEFIVLIKETAIVGYIALEDLTKMGDIIRSQTYSAFFPLIAVALIYLALTTLLTKAFSILERRLRQGDNR